jgi:hypothetical protein
MGIPFEIPETLIYRPPESVFTERKETTDLETSKYFSLFLSNSAVEIKSPWANIKRTQLPARGPYGKLAETCFNFDMDRKPIKLLAGAREREYGTWLSVEDSTLALLGWESLLISYKVKNWLDYFPTTGRIKFYSASFATIGFKIKDVVAPYFAIERVNKKQKVYGGITWFAPLGSVGVQIKDNSLNALFLNFTFNNAKGKLEFDGSDYHYGLFSNSEYVPFDSSLLSRKLYKSSTIEAAFELYPFHFGYERRFFKKVTIQDTSNLFPTEAQNFAENVYSFGINTENFTLFYSHFQSPYSVVKDTLFIALYFREKYYDLALYYNLRSHQEEFNMVNVELNFKTFKNVSPYLKVVNLFDVPGNYLPGIKAKRRYVEIGCQFQREI